MAEGPALRVRPSPCEACEINSHPPDPTAASHSVQFLFFCGIFRFSSNVFIQTQKRWTNGYNMTSSESRTENGTVKLLRKSVREPERLVRIPALPLAGRAEQMTSFLSARLPQLRN